MSTISSRNFDFQALNSAMTLSISAGDGALRGATVGERYRNMYRVVVTMGFSSGCRTGAGGLPIRRSRLAELDTSHRGMLFSRRAGEGERGERTDDGPLHRRECALDHEIVRNRGHHVLRGDGDGGEAP